jgi:hypothetical protein
LTRLSHAQPNSSDFSSNDISASQAGARALALMLLDQMLDLQERLGVISIVERLNSAGRIRSEAEKWSEMSADEYRSRLDAVVRDIEYLQQELNVQIAHTLCLSDLSKSV